MWGLWIPLGPGTPPSWLPSHHSQRVGRARYLRSQALGWSGMQRASIDGVRFNRTGVYRVRYAQSLASTGQCTYKARLTRQESRQHISSLAVNVFEVFSNIVEQGCPHSSILSPTIRSLSDAMSPKIRGQTS